VTLSVGSVTVDCNDVATVAGFWSAALGMPLDPDASPYMASLNRTGTQLPRFLFLKVPEATTAKNRLHLDLLVDQGVPRLREVARSSSSARRTWPTRTSGDTLGRCSQTPRATSSASPPDRDGSCSVRARTACVRVAYAVSRSLTACPRGDSR